MKNLLPYDGEVYYMSSFLDEPTSTNIFNSLIVTQSWQHDEVIMFGKKIITARKVVWVGDENINYKYAGILKRPVPWTGPLVELKTMVQDATHNRFNSCLLNLYENGKQGMSWHSDDEKSLGENNIIVSMSFGAVRKFAFRHKVTQEKISVMLENGSVLIMKGQTQNKWHHALMKSTSVQEARINLTFRNIVAPDQ